MARVKKVEPAVPLDELYAFYREVNRKGFGGYLPDTVPIKFVGTTRSAGKAHAKLKLDPTLSPWVKKHEPRRNATLDYSSLAIDISLDVNRDADHAKAILVHEMIHIYFYCTGDWDEEHGEKFMIKLRELEKATGLKIPVTEKVAAAEVSLHATTIGVIVVKDSSRISFALVTAKVANEQADAIVDRMKYWAKAPGAVKVYTSNSRMVTEQSLSSPTQRSFSAKTKFFSLRDLALATALIHDLEESGTLIQSS
jgi:hypothetical protein